MVLVLEQLTKRRWLTLANADVREARVRPRREDCPRASVNNIPESEYGRNTNEVGTGNVFVRSRNDDGLSVPRMSTVEQKACKD